MSFTRIHCRLQNHCRLQCRCHRCQSRPEEFASPKQNRRAVRVSMGTVFLVPWTVAADPIAELSALGFRTAAMALTDRSISLDAPCLKTEPRLALIMGTEGDGLPKETIASTDYVVKIPMAYGVDSLNVAAAAAVAFWELG